MGLLNKIALGAAGTLLGITTIVPKTLDGIVIAQDAKPMANTSKEDNKIALSTNQQISQNFYNIGEDFYKKAKDKDKALEALGIAAYFDSTNKNITDLIQKVDKDNKLKKNEKESKKIEEKYNKTKTETIDTLYKNGAEKAKTNKDEAQNIFYTILQIDKNSTKFDEALEKELNWKKIDGYLLPPEIASAREKGMKYLNDASEGEEDKTEDDLVTTLKLENNKIYRRKSKDIIVRSTLNEESAKRAHKVSEATMKLLLEYLGLEGKPPYNIRDEKSTESYPYHRITILTSDEELKKFKKSTEWFGLDENININEKWKLEKNDSIYGYGHFHKFISDSNYYGDYNNDQVAHYTLENLIWRSSNYVDNNSEKNSPWLFRSFIYNFTWQTLGTTITTKFLDREDKYDGKIKKISEIKTANQMRTGAYVLANENELISINTLKSLKFDQFTDKAKATAFAVTEYLIHNHKDQMVKLLTDEYNKKETVTDSIYNIQKITGLTPEQLDKNVQEFIRKNYIGYRQIKN